MNRYKYINLILLNIIFLGRVGFAQDIKNDHIRDESNEIPLHSAATSTAMILLGVVGASYEDMDGEVRAKFDIILHSLLFSYFLRTTYFNCERDMTIEKGFSSLVPILLNSKGFNLIVSYPGSFFDDKNVFRGAKYAIRMRNNEMKTKEFLTIAEFEEMNKNFRVFLEGF